jgi:alanine dehydrogenase
MRIGIPREVKEGERRAGLLPLEVAVRVGEGHAVRVESGAGAWLGLADDDYGAAGARIVEADGTWAVDLLVKVKEIQPSEEMRIDHDPAVFGFQHLVGDPEMTRRLAARGATCIAFELVQDAQGRFPLLAPMSVIAGRMAATTGARILARTPGHVLVLGAGNAGVEAARTAANLGSHVTVLTRSERSRDEARRKLGAGVECALADAEAIERHALEADVVVGAVSVSGAPTPKLLSRGLVGRMKCGSVLVDVSIDGGGVAETSHPTTHGHPTYVEEGVVHYCVANMPAAEPQASAAALCAAALPYVRELAGKGVARAVRENPALRSAVVLWQGRVCHRALAQASGLAWEGLAEADLA